MEWGRVARSSHVSRGRVAGVEVAEVSLLEVNNNNNNNKVIIDY